MKYGQLDSDVGYDGAEFNSVCCRHSQFLEQIKLLSNADNSFYNCIIFHTKVKCDVLIKCRTQVESWTVLVGDLKRPNLIDSDVASQIQ